MIGLPADPCPMHAARTDRTGCRELTEDTRVLPGVVFCVKSLAEALGPSDGPDFSVGGMAASGVCGPADQLSCHSQAIDDLGDYGREGCSPSKTSSRMPHHELELE